MSTKPAIEQIKAYSILKAQELELLAEATERCEGMGKGDQFSPSMLKYNNSFQFLSLTMKSFFIKKKIGKLQAGFEP